MRINLVKVNEAFNFLPLVSSLTNLVNIFLKYVYLPRTTAPYENRSDYCKYLDKRNLKQYLLLSIPLLALSQCIYTRVIKPWFCSCGILTDQQNQSHEFTLLREIQKNPRALKSADPWLQDNPTIILEAVSYYPHALQYASPRLKDRDEVVDVAIAQDPSAIRHASLRLRRQHLKIT